VASVFRIDMFGKNGVVSEMIQFLFGALMLSPIVALLVLLGCAAGPL
jgi:hypothetical protein